MRPVAFTVPGEPVPQPRPRVSTRGGFARAYVPSTHPVHHYRKCVAACAINAGLKSTGEPLNVVIDAVFARPKSHMRKSGVKPDAPRLPRPDVDNLAKAVLDALQDVIGDDTCVARLVVEKSYGEEARTTVRVS
ncbi:MAG: RusA family crossover junction endodeoxyribonuclease [Pirellulales bacterium]